MARDAFNDAGVVAEMSSNIVPVLVDGDTEQKAMDKYGIRGFPTVKYMNSKGEVLGELGQRTPAGVLAGAKDAVKKAGPITPSKAYGSVYKARAKVDKALAKNKTAEALQAIQKLEEACQKANHLGLDYQFAQTEKARLNEIGMKALEEAKSLDPEKAKVEFGKIVKDFPGTAAAEEAKKLQSGEAPAEPKKEAEEESETDEGSE